MQAWFSFYDRKPFSPNLYSIGETYCKNATGTKSFQLEPILNLDLQSSDFLQTIVSKDIRNYDIFKHNGVINFLALHSLIKTV